jgi:hypothetical protein
LADVRRFTNAGEWQTPWQNLGTPEFEQHAIATLFQCLRDFCSEK